MTDEIVADLSARVLRFGERISVGIVGAGVRRVLYTDEIDADFGLNVDSTAPFDDVEAAIRDGGFPEVVVLGPFENGNYAPYEIGRLQ